MGLHAVAATATTGWLDHRNTVPHWRGFLEKRIVVDTVEVVGAVGPDRRDLLGCRRGTVRGARRAERVRAQLARVPFGTRTCTFRSRCAPKIRRRWPSATDVLAADHRNNGRTRRRHRAPSRHRPRPRAVSASRPRRQPASRCCAHVKAALDPTGIMNPGVLLPRWPDAILAIDAGTTSIRALVVDCRTERAGPRARSRRRPLSRARPRRTGRSQIWTAAETVVGQALASAGVGRATLAAIGIATQRGTVVVWDRADRPAGRPSGELAGHARHRARSRTAGAGIISSVIRRPPPRLEAVLDGIDRGRERLNAGALLWGNVDTYLAWRLSGGASTRPNTVRPARPATTTISPARGTPR